MAKFLNLFLKTNSKLESDAAVIPRDPGRISCESEKLESQNFSDSQVNHTVTDEIYNTVPLDTPTNRMVLPLNRRPSGQLSLVNLPSNSEQQNVVNNVLNNILTAPQTSINNMTGVHVYQIKNTSNVHIGTSITINSSNTSDSCTKSHATNSNLKWSNLKLSETIRQMMACDDDLDTRMMDVISRHLGYEWKSFARTLNYSVGQIESFECDNKTLSEQIFHFVLDWSRNDAEPSLGNMTNLLWTQNHKETVYYMKKLWKNQNQTTKQ